MNVLLLLGAPPLWADKQNRNKQTRRKKTVLTSGRNKLTSKKKKKSLNFCRHNYLQARKNNKWVITYLQGDRATFVHPPPPPSPGSAFGFRYKRAFLVCVRSSWINRWRARKKYYRLHCLKLIMSYLDSEKESFLIIITSVCSRSSRKLKQYYDGL